MQCLLKKDSARSCATTNTKREFWMEKAPCHSAECLALCSMERNAAVIQSQNIPTSPGNYIYKLSTHFLKVETNSRRGAVSLTAWEGGGI